MQQLSIAAILLSVSLRSLAGDPTDKLSHFKGAENFKSTFPKAEVIDCKNTGEFTEVNFIWNGLHIQAYYDRAGNAVGASREIGIEHLPVTVQVNLGREYPDFIVKEAIEYTDMDNSLSYYVTVTDTKTARVLHISPDGYISVFKRLHGDKRGTGN
ncbi:MAG TPA: hypothetical protein VMH27_06720 [Puia sp.]|nr:hypothetical protein [Puia sp.]